jgi:hypothetical protein
MVSERSSKCSEAASMTSRPAPTPGVDETISNVVTVGSI